MTRKALRAPAVLGLALALGTTACQSPPAATPGPTQTTAPTATTAPSVAPTATAAADVVPLFIAKVDDLKVGVMHLTGTATVGLVQLEISGSSIINGIDSSNKITTTVSGISVTSDLIQTGGKRWARTGNGPWLEQPITSGSSDLTSQLQESAKKSLVDKGVETFHGKPAHRLEIGAGAAFDPAAILASIAGATNVEVSLAYFCADDGTPVGATIEASWTQTVNDQAVSGSMDFEVQFTSLGIHQTITAPEHVWQSFTSPRYKYSLAYPDDWTFFKTKFWDEFDAPYLAYVLGGRYKSGGFNLGTWAKSEVSLLKKDFKSSSATNDEYKLAGQAARFLELKGKLTDGTKVVVYEVVAIKGGQTYIVTWISEIGHESEDKATFEQMLSTFRYP